MITFLIYGAALCIYWCISFFTAYRLFSPIDEDEYIHFMMCGLTFGGVIGIVWATGMVLKKIGRRIFNFYDRIFNNIV